MRAKQKLRIFEPRRHKPSRKAQIISMDFVMTFAIYIFALSVFFFALKGNFTDNTSLDVNAELIFNKLTNAYDLETDILDGAKISNLDQFDGEPNRCYDVFFKDFENPNFKKIDYCVFLQHDNNIKYHFAAYSDNFGADEFTIYLGGTKCGIGAMERSDVKPSCKAKETIVIEKPVFYDGQIMKLKVLVCGE